MSKSARKILDTAEHLFNIYSFTGVGVDLIRDQSGCSKTTLYTYYQNKQQLVRSVLEARDQRFCQALNEAVKDLQGKEAVDAIVNWHLKWFQQPDFKGCLFVRAMAETVPDEYELKQLIKAHKQYIYALIEKHCVKANKQHLSAVIYTLIEGYMIRCLVEGYEQAEADRLIVTLDQLWALGSF